MKNITFETAPDGFTSWQMYPVYGTNMAPFVFNDDADPVFIDDLEGYEYVTQTETADLHSSRQGDPSLS